MTKNASCGVRFMVQYPPFFGELACERERFHDDFHEAEGFVWGPRDQSRDPFVVRVREAVEARRKRSRAWYRKLAR